MLDESLKVKEALVSNIKPVVQLVGQDRFANTFQEMVLELSAQVSWRTRKSALNAMTLMNFPPDVVANLITILMKDEVSHSKPRTAHEPSLIRSSHRAHSRSTRFRSRQCFELRSHAAAHVREIFQKYPHEAWLLDKIIHLIQDLSYAVEKYAFRVTAAKALEAVSQAVSLERMDE